MLLATGRSVQRMCAQTQEKNALAHNFFLEGSEMPRRAKKTVNKQLTDGEKVYLSVRIDSALDKRIEHFSTDTDRSKQDLVTEAMLRLLEDPVLFTEQGTTCPGCGLPLSLTREDDKITATAKNVPKTEQRLPKLDVMLDNYHGDMQAQRLRSVLEILTNTSSDLRTPLIAIIEGLAHVHEVERKTGVS